MHHKKLCRWWTIQTELSQLNAIGGLFKAYGTDSYRLNTELI